MNIKKFLAFAILPLLVSCGGKTSDTSASSITPSSSAAPISSAAPASSTTPTSSAAPASSTTPTSSAAPGSSVAPDSSIAPTSEDSVSSDSSVVESSASASVDPFIMEAEYTNLNDENGNGKQGNGYSGGAVGKEMVQQDTTGDAGASNGYWVGYLYHTDITLDFVFDCDKAIDDVTLTLRLTCEIMDITLTSDNYKIYVNDTELTDYGTITLSGASSSDSDNYIRPFTDFKCRKNISLKQGENKIVFKTANSEGMGGTMYATAPMFDCVKLGNLSGAALSYTEITDNLSLFEE